MTNDNLLEMDELSLYFGEPYKVNDYITITLPKVVDVVRYGEREYYSMVQTITAIPSDMKAQLWDMKPSIDWTKITDFELFMMLAPTLPRSKTQIIFGDLDLQRMRPFENKTNDTIVLANPETGVVIDELAYGKITSYLCTAHGITKKVEKAANEFTKKFMIEEDRQKIKYVSGRVLAAVRCIRQQFCRKRRKTNDYIFNLRCISDRRIFHLWKICNKSIWSG